MQIGRTSGKENISDAVFLPFIYLHMIDFEFTGIHTKIITFIIGVMVDQISPPWDRLGFHEIGNIIP